jgi:hypothetical protein
MMISRIRVFDGNSTAEAINAFIATLPKDSNVSLETSPTLIIVYYTTGTD